MRPARTVFEVERPPMSNRKVALHFLVALGLFLGVPVVIALFARLVM